MKQIAQTPLVIIFTRLVLLQIRSFHLVVFSFNSGLPPLVKAPIASSMANLRDLELGLDLVKGLKRCSPFLRSLIVARFCRNRVNLYTGV